VDLSSGTISWSFDTGQMWNRQEVMSVELRKGFPWLLVIIGAIFFALLAVLVHWMFRFARKSHFIERIRHLGE